MRRRELLALTLTGVIGSLARGKDGQDLKAFTIEFPNHSLDFSVHEKIAREMGPYQVQPHFDPSNATEFERGFRILVRMMYDFEGPAWVGALGSRNFWVFVQQRRTEFEGDIATTKGLKDYIAKWDQLANNPLICTFDEIVVNGVPAVSRQFGKWNEIVSFPLDQTAFIDFGLRIERVAGKSNGSWAKKAEAMRDAIRNTIAFRPKSSANSWQDPRVA